MTPLTAVTLSPATGFLWGSIPNHCCVLPLLGRGVYGLMARIGELLKAWRSSSGSSMKRALPSEPQRLHLMQPMSRSP